MVDVVESFNPIVALVSGILGMIIGTAGLLVAIRSYRVNMRALIVGKAFDAPILSMKLFGADGCDDFIIAVPINKGRITEVQMPLTIENIGKKTADEISVYVRMNKELAYGGYVTKDKKSTVTKLSVSGNFLSTISNEKPLNPQTAKMLIHPLSLRKETLLKGDVTGNTENGTPISLYYTFVYSYEIHVVVSYRDNSPVAKRYRVRIANTADRSIREYIEEYNEISQERFSQIPILTRLRRFMNPRDSLGLRRIAIIVPHGQLSSQKSTPIDLLSYDKFGWYDGLEDERGVYVPGIQQA